MKLLRVGAIVSIAWFAAAALTPLTSVAIRNSTMDSTLIGGTTPAVVRATYTQVNSVTPSTLPSQGLYTGWNRASSGDGDFFDHPGSGAGGFNWYQTNSSGAIGAALMSLSSAGTLQMDTLAAGGLSAQSQYPSATGFVNGAWLEWNQSFPNTGTSVGETDFINQHATGGGGFTWYDTTSATSSGSQIARLDGSGNLTLRSVVTTAGLTGSLSGNASTATALAATPAVCPVGEAASAISSNGTPTCVWIAHTGNGSSCVTGSGSFSTCTSTVTWENAFPDANYRMSCTIISPSDPRASINGIVGKAAATATVQIVTNGSVAVSFAGLDCIAQHN